MRAAGRIGAAEKKALRFIARRESRGEPSPGVREICCAAGLESPGEVRNLLCRLAESGYLLRDADWSRMLRLTEPGWRLAKELCAAGETGRVEGGGDPAPPDGAPRRLLC